MSLLIGWGEIDITPDEPVDLAGQYYHRPSTGIHSRLTATALALTDSNHEHAIMVSVDVVSIDGALQDELRQRLKNKADGLHPDAVVLNAIHTHTAPLLSPVTPETWLKELPDVLSAEAFREFLLTQLTQLVVETWNSREPSGIAPAFTSARIGHSRRALYRDGSAEMYGKTNRPDFIGMESGEDSGIETLFTFNSKNEPTGVIVNVACPSQVMESTYKISSDYLGDVRRRMKVRFGKDFRVLGQISAAGCQSPRDLTRNYKGEPDFWHADGVTELGRRVATAVEHAYDVDRGSTQTDPVLRVRRRKIKLPIRQVSGADVAQAKATLNELLSKQPEEDAFQEFCDQTHANEQIPGRPGPYDDKLHPFSRMQMAKAVINRQAYQEDNPFFEMELFSIRLNDVVFVTNPFELFLDYGQQIKARSPAGQTFIVQLAGDSEGYLPTSKAEQAGGYGGMIGNGSVGAQGGATLVEETLQEIQALMA